MEAECIKGSKMLVQRKEENVKEKARIKKKRKKKEEKSGQSVRNLLAFITQLSQWELSL